MNYYAFCPFCLIAKVLKKTEKEKTKKIKFDITMLGNRVAIPPDIENVDKRTCTPSINIVVNQALTLMASMVSRDIYVRKEFLSKQPILSFSRRKIFL